MIYNIKNSKISRLTVFFFAVCWIADVHAVDKPFQTEEAIHPSQKMAAGVLPFFDDGKTVLLGKEFRKKYDILAWMEFGGNQEGTETFAQTAHREANEETAGTLQQQITLERVMAAENDGHYVEYLNPNTGICYRMYCLFLEGQKPTVEVFEKNAENPALKEHLDKIAWQYFDTSVVMNALAQDVNLGGTDAPLYSTMKTRLNLLKDKEFFKPFINSK